MDENETTATEHWETDELMNPRPKWPKVIGIISIAFAAFGLTCGGLAMVWAGLVAPGFMEQALEGDPYPDGMKLNAIDYAIGGSGFILALVLLFAGIACVTHRPSTRIMHLVYAGVSIPLNIVSYLNQMAKQESIQQWAQDYPNNPIAQSMDPSNAGAAVGQIIGLVFFMLLGIGVPLFYLIWFGLLKTKPIHITGDDDGIY